MSLQRDNEKALTLLRESHALAPTDIIPVLKLAWVLYNLGELEEASVIYEQVKSKHPFDYRALYHIGCFAYSCGDIPKAFEVRIKNIYNMQ